MRHLLFGSLLAIAVLSTGCGDRSGSTPKPFILKFFGFRADVRTIVVKVPALGSLECSRRIQDALAKTEGIRSTRPDLASRTVEVEYDAIKLGIKNIEYVIAGAGFDANDTVAPAEARKAVPPECR